MKELIEFLARSLVDDPDAVEVEEEEEDGRVYYRLYVADDDMGKVIGKEGRIANALRTLLKVAAARYDTRAHLEIGA
jgi:predicted RNA-binding protein YlqC (UPF0109 family)